MDFQHIYYCRYCQHPSHSPTLASTHRRLLAVNSSDFWSEGFLFGCLSAFQEEDELSARGFNASRAIYNKRWQDIVWGILQVSLTLWRDKSEIPFIPTVRRVEPYHLEALCSVKHSLAPSTSLPCSHSLRMFPGIAFSINYLCLNPCL